MNTEDQPSDRVTLLTRPRPAGMPELELLPTPDFSGIPYRWWTDTTRQMVADMLAYLYRLIERIRDYGADGTLLAMTRQFNDDVQKGLSPSDALWDGALTVVALAEAAAYHVGAPARTLPKIAAEQERFYLVFMADLNVAIRDLPRFEQDTADFLGFGRPNNATSPGGDRA